jgi:hypothetical protein
MNHRTILRRLDITLRPSPLTLTDGDRQLIEDIEAAIAKASKTTLSGTFKVIKDCVDVCRHCGREWSNTSCEHNFGCCPVDRKNMQDIALGVYKIT